MIKFLRWLFSFGTITAMLLGGLVGWQIRQYNINVHNAKTINKQFNAVKATFKHNKEVREATWKLDSVQSIRILEIKKLIDKTTVE